MSLYEYTKWDGSQQFQPQSADKAFDQHTEYLMQYGDQVLRKLDRFDDDDPPEIIGDQVLRKLDQFDDDAPEIIELLQKEGYIERDEKGQWRVAPKGVRRVQDGALSSLFQVSNRGALGKHDTPDKGAGAVRLDDSRPYVYGDSLANLNLHETLKNALIRQGGGAPIRLRQDDYVVHETEFQASCSTVVLIDMSGSMSRYGKYAVTKKAALALQAMVRAQYPQDSLQLVGFYTLAHVLTERQLLDSAPKPAGMYDSRIHLRLSLDDPLPRQAQHFTNIHAGLRLARSLLGRQGARNKQIIVITDGEPTAHIEGREAVLIYPPSGKTAKATLAEAKRCASAGIRVSSFALIEDYYYHDLVNFVEDMARVTRGVSVSCAADNLGAFVLDSFLGGRHQRRTGR